MLYPASVSFACFQQNFREKNLGQKQQFADKEYSLS